MKLYKRALLEAGRTSATVARRLSVLRGTYKQLAAKGLVSWETAQDIAAVKAPGVQKNSTPSLTQKQAIALLEAIPADTLQGIRDLALMSVFFLTGCRVSAVTGACVGPPRDRRRRALPARHREAEQEAAEDPPGRGPAGPGLRGAGRHRGGQGGAAVPADDAGRDAASIRRHLDRKTPWRLVKKYCQAAGIDPDRLGGRGIGIHSLAEDRDQRRHPQRGFDARGARVRRPQRHPHHRGLLRPEGGRRRGGGPADPDPSDGPPRASEPARSRPEDAWELPVWPLEMSVDFPPSGNMS